MGKLAETAIEGIINDRKVESKMKILIVRPLAIEEDCAKNIYNNQGIGLATQLSKLGNDCALIYYAKKGKGFVETIDSEGETLTIYHIEGINIIWMALYNKSIWDICEKYDLIQTSEYDQIFSWQLQRKYPEKTVIYHGPYPSPFTWKHNLKCKAFDFLFLWRKAYKDSYVITKSRLAEKYLLEKGFHNVRTIGVGLNPSVLKYNTMTMPEKLVKLRNEKGEKKYLLYVGAISKRKNLKFILKILKALVFECKREDMQLIVVGGKAYHEDNYYKECFNFIEDCNLEKNIVYIERLTQPQIAYIYEIADVFLLATQYDIFGMVYLEAMYFGIPIITTMCGGSSLLIEDGKNGYIRDLKKIDSWIDTILSIIDNPDIVSRIKLASSELVREKYLWESLAPSFVEVYKERLGHEI